MKAKAECFDHTSQSKILRKHVKLLIDKMIILRTLNRNALGQEYSFSFSYTPNIHDCKEKWHDTYNFKSFKS